MNRNDKKGRNIILAGIAMTLLGIAGIVFFLIQIRNYPGQSMPGKELFGAFILSPALLFGGIITAGRTSAKYGFVPGIVSHETVKKRLIMVFIVAVLASAALIIRLRSVLAVVLSAVMITVCVCALLQLKDSPAYLKACFLVSLAATFIAAAALSTLRTAPGGTILIVNGFRTYMSHRTENFFGFILLLIVGPIFLTWPLAIFSKLLYTVCTWEL